MALTYTSISSTTLGSSQSTVTLSSIPNTYTDLMVLCSLRGDRQVNADPVEIVLNGVSSGYSYRILATGGSVSSLSGSNDSRIYLDGLVPQAFFNSTNLFNTFQVYIPNYAGSTVKPLNTFGGWTSPNEPNINAISTAAALSTSTSAISSIRFQGNGYIAGSSFHLYGIKKD